MMNNAAVNTIAVAISNSLSQGGLGLTQFCHGCAPRDSALDTQSNQQVESIGFITSRRKDLLEHVITHPLRQMVVLPNADQTFVLV